MSDGVFSRRTMLAVPAIAMLGSAAACAGEGGSNQVERSKTLVAHLTRSGNTRVIAETLHRKLGADLFEIRAAPSNAGIKQSNRQQRQIDSTGCVSDGTGLGACIFAVNAIAVPLRRHLPCQRVPATIVAEQLEAT